MANPPPKRFPSRFRDQTRVNERIRAPKVRVIDSATGQQLGVMSAQEALRRAKEVGLDLVEIAANADPPVCKIVDYGKYKYEKSKQLKDARPKGSKMKEVKFGVGIDSHDYRIKMIKAEAFLDEGHKVLITLMFKGRQMAHREIGFDLMKTVSEDLKKMANVDVPPRMAGKRISMQLTPLAQHLRVRHFKPINAKELEDSQKEEAHDEEDDDHDHDHDHGHEDHRSEGEAPGTEADHQ